MNYVVIPGEIDQISDAVAMIPPEFDGDWMIAPYPPKSDPDAPFGAYSSYAHKCLQSGKRWAWINDNDSTCQECGKVIKVPKDIQETAKFLYALGQL